MCGAQTSSPGEVSRQLQELGSLLERGRDRLLDEDVLARLERGLRQRPVLVHARQHEDDVDLGVEITASGPRSSGSTP